MPIKVLIADDEDVIRSGLVKYLKLHTDRFGHIYEAENGQEAIDLLLRHQPELLVLDMQMPLKTGLDVMREAAKAGVIPITVILSGYEEFKYAQEALKFGAKDYLLKPARAADILACLNRLADEYIGKAEESEPHGGPEAPNPFVREAVEYMTEHYMEELTLSEIAQRLGISTGYLSTLFNQSLGCGFTEHLNRIRIERACCYLEQNYLKNYEIAYKVGFRDEKYFSRVFKKIKGVSPKGYRKKGLE